eukprot:TRINITY_DN798_c0_g1_i1.p1 TRINITY_DN798_c0_g1~~TRINITY_DN798_c0_g1_i1.p1  ORF type:complete len:319 (+),score=83.77 TRINITY_DN798_c0_g1_i1:378-1334(+)
MSFEYSDYPFVKFKLSESWEVAQDTAFRFWINEVFKKNGINIKIKDICEDFSDGENLNTLLQCLSGKENTFKFTSSPQTRAQKLDNLTIALNFAETLGFSKSTLSIQPSHFVDAEKSSVLGFFWALCLYYQIRVISEDGNNSEEGLLNWCKATTLGYEDVDISYFNTSFYDGIAFLALAHRVKPNDVNYHKLCDESYQARLKVAFDVFENELKVPPILDISDIVDGNTDDQNLILYLSLIYHEFKEKEKKGEIPKLNPPGPRPPKSAAQAQPTVEPANEKGKGKEKEKKEPKKEKKEKKKEEKPKEKGEKKDKDCLIM